MKGKTIWYWNEMGNPHSYVVSLVKAMSEQREFIEKSAYDRAVQALWTIGEFGCREMNLEHPDGTREFARSVLKELGEIS